MRDRALYTGGTVLLLPSPHSPVLLLCLVNGTGLPSGLQGVTRTHTRPRPDPTRSYGYGFAKGTAGKGLTRGYM
jgi:hypothetical protein